MQINEQSRTRQLADYAAFALFILPVTLAVLVTCSPLLLVAAVFVGLGKTIKFVRNAVRFSTYRTRLVLGLSWFGVYLILSLAHRLSGRTRVVARLTRRVVALMYGLPPAVYRVRREHVTILLGDGVGSAATLFRPEDAAEGSCPTILIRTPYDRANVAATAVIFAERGFFVVTQDTRGRADSGGDFFPIANEQRDGAATLDWIAQQPWFCGAIGMYGISYMGLVCWAAMAARRPSLQAVYPVLAASHLHPIMFPGGALALELVLRWSYMVLGLTAATTGALRRFYRGFIRPERRYFDALMHLPLAEVDRLVSSAGEQLGFIQEGLRHTRADSAFWADKNELVDLRRGGPDAPAMQLVAGWHDFFLDEQLKDYATASEAVGRVRPVRLTIGPWQHWSVFDYSPFILRDAVRFFNRQLTVPNATGRARHYVPEPERLVLEAHPVRVYLVGANRWRHLAAWPPPCHELALYLGAGGTLTADAPTGKAGGEHSYTYDPADPTPALGGPSFDPLNAGARDQRALEARTDVAVFTSAELDDGLELVGTPHVLLGFSSSAPSTDVVVRLCDVWPSGASVNICEGVVRLTDAAGAQTSLVNVRLGACGIFLAAGHRLRLHVCSGAHPRIMRNLGTGDELFSATGMRVQHQKIALNGQSCVILPVMQSSGGTDQ